ncbi:MAG: histidine kinase [Clostridiales bacterium]|nr:MAG: histidine kinase [Clostridiales bacterium]
MGKKISVLIAENRRDTRELIKRYLMTEKVIEVVGEADTGPAAVELAERLTPDIVLIYSEMQQMDGYEACEKITETCRSTSVIIMAREIGAEQVRKAMVSGAKDYITMPLDINRLISTIRLTYKKSVKFEIPKATDERKDKKDGRIIGIFSTKGGVGKTTIALNLAVDMAKKSRGRIALVDLDLQFGDVALMANLEPEMTIADIMEETASIDTSTINGLMTEYMANLMVLASPPSPEYAEYIGGETIREILSFLRQTYDYVVIDMASSFSDATLAALDFADEIFMVSAMDIVSVKNVKIGIEIMKSLEYPDEKIKILVNMANPKLGIGYADLERIFERKIDYKIPEAKKSLIKAVNKGVPHISTRGSGKTNKAFGRISKGIIKR